eukprot:2210320-Rhodomonas_salina.1
MFSVAIHKWQIRDSAGALATGDLGIRVTESGGLLQSNSESAEVPVGVPTDKNRNFRRESELLPNVTENT